MARASPRRPRRARNGIGGVGACFRARSSRSRWSGGRHRAECHIAEAIDYAVDHRAAVVNISLIGRTPRPTRECHQSCARRRHPRRRCSRERGEATSPLSRRHSGRDLGRCVDPRRSARSVLQPRHLGEVRCARVRADRRPRRWLGRRLRDVDVAAACRRDHRAHAHSSPIRHLKRDLSGLWPSAARFPERATGCRRRGSAPRRSGARSLASGRSCSAGRCRSQARGVQRSLVWRRRGYTSGSAAGRTSASAIAGATASTYMPSPPMRDAGCA